MLSYLMKPVLCITLVVSLLHFCLLPIYYLDITKINNLHLFFQLIHPTNGN